MSNTSISEQALIATIRELYKSKDEDESLPTFFRLVSNEGEEFKVHSALMVTRYDNDASQASYPLLIYQVGVFQEASDKFKFSRKE